MTFITGEPQQTRVAVKKHEEKRGRKIGEERRDRRVRQ